LLPRLANVYLLEFPQKDNSFRRALAERASLVTLPHNLEGAQKAIAALNLDILVYLDLGLDHLTWFLPFSRLATLQCALYGHPMTTGIPNLDIFLSPAPMEPPEAEKYYSEALYALPCLLSGFSPPPAQTAALKQAHKGHIYLCAQSLFKVHPDMDNALLTILRNDAGAELHFFVSGREQETHALQKRLHRSLGTLSSQLRWREQCSAQEFSAALRAADVVLDTAYFSGGSTSFKALGEGVPVLTLEGAFMRGRQTSGMYRYLGDIGKLGGKDNLGGLDELIAHSWEEYSDKALNLANSPMRRRELRELLLANNYRLFEDAESISQLEAFLLTGKVL
jgi:predicted O-linked N-acetylglucosamine transferase (SPINDLY family)